VIWQDFLIDRWVGASVLRHAAAEALAISDRDVAVTDDAQQLLATPEHVRVILERTRLQRQFPLHVMAVLRDADLERRFAAFDTTLDAVRQLARRIEATVLVAGPPATEGEWIRVGADGGLDIVALDVDETDDDDAYFIVGSRPFPDQSASPRSTPRQLTA
jgi:hypothetical protein